MVLTCSRGRSRLPATLPGSGAQGWREHGVDGTGADPLAEAVAEVVSAERVAMARETLARLVEAFRHLPIAQQLALELVRVEGFSMAAAADNLGVTIASIKMSVFRGGAALRDALVDGENLSRPSRGRSLSCTGSNPMASADQRSRVIAAIGEIAAPTRSELVRRQVWLIIAGVAGALALFWVEGGLRATGRPPSLVAWTSLGTSCFVGVGMWFLFTRGRSGLRRRWPVLVPATLRRPSRSSCGGTGSAASTSSRVPGPRARVTVASR